VTLFVDTSVWSLAFRRDAPQTGHEEIAALRTALEGGQPIVTTGLVLQEVLQGFAGPSARKQLIEHFGALPLLAPERQDHVEAAELRNKCRRAGVQVGTVDVLLAQLCIRHELTMLSADRDFEGIAAHSSLRMWNGRGSAQAR
jgi:predicted nucleic acid-binding protein